MRGALLMMMCACTETAFEPAGPPGVVLATGHDELVPLADGDAVPIVAGPQGGSVVWAAITAHDLDPHDLELVFSIVPPEGAPSSRRVIVDLDDDSGASIGHQVFLPDVAVFAGVPCSWRVDARDRAGRTASDQKVVIPLAE